MADATLLPGTVVIYKGKYYLFLRINTSGKAQLLTAEGKKYSGTPEMGKITELVNYKLKRYSYNTYNYVYTKLGLVSLTTGNIMSDVFTRLVISQEQ